MKKSAAMMKALATKLTYEMLYQEQQLVEWDVCGLPETSEFYKGFFRTKSLWAMLEGLRDEVEEGQRNNMFLTPFEVGCFMDIGGLMALASEAHSNYAQRASEMDLTLIVVV